MKEGQVVNKLYDLYTEDHKRQLSSEEIIQQVQQRQSNSPGMHPRGAAGSVVVKGVHDVSIRFSKCCNPVPGDDIVGFITRGRGISIHRTDCSNVVNVAEEDKDRIIEASWIENAAQKKEEGFLVEIKIFATDRAGLLNDLTRIFSEKDISILRISSMTSKQGIATLLFGFEVKCREETARHYRLPAGCPRCPRSQEKQRLTDLCLKRQLNPFCGTGTEFSKNIKRKDRREQIYGVERSYQS